MNLIVRRSHASKMLLCLCLAALFMSGCMKQVRRNIEETEKSSAIVGDIANSSTDPTKIVVVAVRDSQESVAAFNYTSLNSFGRFILRVKTLDSYYLVAFADVNQNLVIDPDEPAGLYPDKVVTSREAGAYSVHFSLTDSKPIPERIRNALSTLSTLERKPLPVNMGTLADISDERFSAEYGKKGLWEFFDFITNVGIGVYFLEPYDPDRIPVLFVNGAGGSPQDWRYFFSHLDKSRYQAWFFLYPSGARLDSSADTLQKIMKRLHERYNFRRVYVTAHSMGGLVSRGFIQKALSIDNADYIKLFVSISTPWQGHSAARYGVSIAPATIPSWIDMVPGSDYQKAIFNQRLGSGIDYYLLFGYRGGTSLFSENNDGTVALSSVIHLPAQQEATKIFGFNEDHTSILFSRELFETYQRILEDTDNR